MKMNDELRACPFCGNPRVKLVGIPAGNGFRERFCVRCDYNDGGCGAEGGWRHYMLEAMDVWNMRRRKWQE